MCSNFVLRECHVMFSFLFCIDLMLPGVVGPEQGGTDFSILRKGQICAVNVVGNR